jgi:hypothetical protein
MTKLQARGLVVALLLTVSATAFAASTTDSSQPVGRMRLTSAAVEWQPAVANEKLILTVAGPGGLAFTKEFASGVQPLFRLQDFGVRLPVDGTYQYELRVVPRISADVRQKLAAAREAEDDDAIARIQAEANLDQPVVQSGSFTIKSNAFVSNDATERANGGGLKVTATRTLNPSPNDQVIPDDLIVQGSACVGLDCVVDESFGFDTLRLKENNTRIKFQDTSTGTGFPANNWQLTANDSASGGANKFSIDDVTGSKTPFTVIAGAPTNSVFVDSSGRLGLRTGTPVLDVHVHTSNTPAMRFEQDNAIGFTAQTWDVAGNEANFFVRDVTGGSRLPFRIRPGAPTSSIDIAANGNVGIGTASPQTRLDVRSNDVSADVFEAIGTNPISGPSFNFGYSGQTFGRSSGFFNVRPDASATAPNPSLRFMVANVQYMMIDNQGYLGVGAGMADPLFPIHHVNGAYLSVGGVWTNASSRAYKQDIAELSADEAECALENLKPIKYAYKSDPAEHHVGFVAEDVPDLVATGDRKGLSAMDIVAVLTKVVQEQQQTIEKLTRRVDELDRSHR